MDFRLQPQEEALRREVCEFLRTELGTGHDSDPAPMPPGYMPAREFELKLGTKGWLGLSWPVEYGGGGRPVSEQFVIEEEIALHRGPASDAIARIIVAPILLAAGSEAQKREYLPRLARGEITFCLGYTEPESGSDLASLQTRAVREGDDYTIYGPFLHWRTLLALVRKARESVNGDARWKEAPVREALAQLTIDFEVARLLLQRAIQMHGEGADYRPQAAMCKLFNTELAQRIY